MSKAYEGKATIAYDASCDCMTNSATGTVYHADESRGFFVDQATGDNLAQGWTVIVGLDNSRETFTDPALAGPLLGIAAWNFGFAILTVVITFAAGLLVAITLNSPRVRGLRF